MFTKGEQHKGKKRFSNPPVRAAKITDFNIYVLPAPTDLTPNGSSDLELAHAGLGKRVVSLPEDCKHQEVINYDDAAVFHSHTIPNARQTLYF